MTKLDEFYYQQKEPIAGCLLALRQLLLDYHSSVEESWYYRLPCFFYEKKLFCYVWVDKKKKSPYIAFYPGKKLTNPLLEMGNRTHSKILRIDPKKDIPLHLIYEITDEAVAHLKNSISPYTLKK